MHHLDFPGFGRLQYEHRIVDLREKGFVGFDDELTINTQTSSQWDGFKHVSDQLLFLSMIFHFSSRFTNPEDLTIMSSHLQWALQKQALFYNGATVEETRDTLRNGIHSQGPNLRLKEIKSPILILRIQIYPIEVA